MAQEYDGSGAQATELYLPQTLPFPITITRIYVHRGKDVERGSRLFDYDYYQTEKEWREEDEEEAGGPSGRETASKRATPPNMIQVRKRNHFESAIEGKVEQIHFKCNQCITDPRRPFIAIKEPCTHGIQFGGLCGLCGKDLTGNDYIGFSHTSRATIQMAHDNLGLTVSQSEAERLEEETTRRLLDAKKLSLIVDLDQTIIHATTDPTVAEWKRNPSNPNFAALSTVEEFGLWSPATQRDEIYYIKPRPLLRSFLEKMSKLYEMHVYTMGTRTYADAVVKIIDPTGAFFGRRILSRDESGSLNQKTISRLFPCDTSMVVIIDDRSDVWDWSPNLLKVVPYSFFIGTGDLNSSFLPPLQPIVKEENANPSDSMQVHPSDSQTLDPEVLIPGASTHTPPIVEDDVSVSASSGLVTQSARLAAEISRITEPQVAKPLEKAQQAQDELLKDEEKQVQATQNNDLGTALRSEEHTRQDESIRTDAPGVLHDNDSELLRLEQFLMEIHSSFYGEAQGHARDVKRIVPSLKESVLAGCRIAFSGVIPLDAKSQESEIWKLALQFGAACVDKVEMTTTHLVARMDGTQKVMRARHFPNIHVVTLAWLLDSVALWKRASEAAYTLPTGQSGTPVEIREEEDLVQGSSQAAEPVEDATNGLTESQQLAHVPDIDWSATFDKLGDDGWDSNSNVEEDTDGESSRHKRMRTKTETLSDADSARTESPLSKRVKLSRSRETRLRQATGPLEETIPGTLPSPALSDDRDGADVQSRISSQDDFDDFAADLEAEMG